MIRVTIVGELVVMARIVVTALRQRILRRWKRAPRRARSSVAAGRTMCSGILRRMATIAVFNQKGGVGRTTTTLNVLAAIAQRGRRPWGIDLDPNAQLSQVFDVRPRAAESMYAFFAHGVSLADIAQITRSGVVLCPGHAELAKLDAVLGRSLDVVMRLRTALRQPDVATDPVVIDCPALLNVLTLNALLACNLALVPVSCEFLAVRSAADVGRALDALEPVLKQHVPRRYVLTRYTAGERMSEEAVQRLQASVPVGEICATRIRAAVEVAESPLAGLDVFRHAPESTGALDHQALVDELAAGGFGL